MIDILFNIMLIYAVQMALMTLILVIIDSRPCKNISEFLTMTFLPIAIFKLKSYKRIYKVQKMEDKMVWYPSDKDYKRLGLTREDYE